MKPQQGFVVILQGIFATILLIQINSSLYILLHSSIAQGVKIQSIWFDEKI